METQRENDSFNYTYSAKQQEEVKNIRNKYASETEDKFGQLVRLDRGVTQKAMSVSLTVGIIGTLVMGIGMSLLMTLGESSGLIFALGVCICVVGMAVAGIAYPVYSYVIRKERARVAPEIIRLTDELMK